MDAGYSPDLFWSLGIDEIIDLLESYGRRMEIEQKKRISETKDQIMLMWNQNLQLMNMLANSNNPDEVPLKQPHEYYPELFGEEVARMAEEAKVQSELEKHKVQMVGYMLRVNQLRKERGESSGGNDT